jgi:hypothetical protein
MSTPTPRPAHRPKSTLTHDIVTLLCGDIGDDKAAAILGTGATVEELEEAIAFAAGQSDVMGDERRPLMGIVAELNDILTADEPFDEERR